MKKRVFSTLNAFPAPRDHPDLLAAARRSDEPCGPVDQQAGRQGANQLRGESASPLKERAGHPEPRRSPAARHLPRQQSCFPCR